MDKILEVKNLRVAFRTTNGALKAVRNISFDLERGKTLAIVGESGSGKSVTSKAVIGILAGNSIVEGGEILYDGKDLLRISEDEMHKIRGDKISMIFQESMLSYLGIVKLGSAGTTSLGTLLSDASSIWTNYPHLMICPALVISLLMISFNLFGNGLRDAFNPSLRGVEE